MPTMMKETDARISTYTADLARKRMQFRFWHVEPLINQALIIAERMLSDKRDLQAIEARTALLALEAIDIDADAEREAARKINEYYSAQARSLAEMYGEAKNASSNQRSAYREATEPTKSAYAAQVAIFQGNENALSYDLDAANKEAVVKKTEAAARGRRKEELDLARAPDGPLDYKSQAALIQRRIEQDYFDARDRALVAAEGIEQLFGNFETDGGPITWNNEADSDLDQIDRLALWLRRVARTLSIIAQREQVFSKIISIRNALGAESWKAFMEDLVRVGDASCRFFISRGCFPPHAFGRFRGLTAYTMGETGIYEMHFALPTSAVVGRPDGGSAQIDQSEVPESFLGRVLPIDAMLQPQMAGTNSLINLSPFGNEEAGEEGEWQVRIKKISPLNPVKLDDIFIEISLAVLPR